MRYDLWKTQRDQAEILPCGLKVLREDKFKPCVMVWMPKAEKPFAHYSFRTPERREEYIQETIKNFEATKVIKAKWKADRLGTDEDLKKVKVGDLYSSSWGYDQTNIDYYQVISVNGHMATIQEVSQHDSLDRKAEMTCDYVMPAPNKFIGEPILKRIQFSGGRPYFYLTSYSSATPFEGKAHYQTNPAFGH